MEKWRRIDRQLTKGEVDILFFIPYSRYVFAHDMEEFVGLPTFYRLIGKLVELDMVEVSKQTRIREARKYRRKIRHYRISSDGNGGFIISVQ